MTLRKALALFLIMGICLGVGMALEAELGLWDANIRQAGSYIQGITSDTPSWLNTTNLVGVLAGAAVIWVGLRSFRKIKRARNVSSRPSFQDRVHGRQMSRSRAR